MQLSNDFSTIGLEARREPRRQMVRVKMESFKYTRLQMRTLSMLLLASAALAVVGQIAGAADMPPILKAPPPPPASSYSWNGIYIGGHIGVGMSRDVFDPALDNFPSPFSGFLCGDSSTQLCPGGLHHGQGPMGGGQAGINVQRGAALFGIEGTYSAADTKGRHSYLTPEFTLADSFFGTTSDGFTTVSGAGTTTTRAKALASITGRLGLVSGPGDRTLFYV